MRIGRSTATHGQSAHPLYGGFIRFRHRVGCTIAWDEFRTAHPIPVEYIRGLNDCHVGLVDKSKPATLDNMMWVLKKRRMG